MQAFFIQLSLPNSNTKKSERILAEYTLTEQSLLDNFEKIFGPRSLVLAKCVYILASRKQDHIKFNFLEFMKPFIVLFDNNKKERNRVAFNFLDLEQTQSLHLMTLIQIHKELPDRCLLKFELQM